MANDGSRPARVRRAGKWALVAAVAVCAAAALASNRQRLAGALMAMDPAPAVAAVGLCLVYRLVNAHGWTMVVRALGQPLPAGEGQRIWLASEACRWLPGGVWSYGSRGVLAARAGVPPVVGAASLAWELALTVLAWGLGAAAGLLLWSGDLPPAVTAAVGALSHRAGPALLVAVALGGAAVALWGPARRRLAKVSDMGRRLGDVRTDRRGLVRVLGFYVGMVVLNALTFWVVVWSTPGGRSCPFAVALAANSVSWLVGLFALFAPGGLVVREATLGVMLSGWLTAEEAVTVALAWRAIQVLTEVAGYALVALSGRVARLPEPGPGVPLEGV